MKEHILSHGDTYTVKVLELDTGQTLGMRYHGCTFYCLYGNGILRVSNGEQVHERFMMPGRYHTIEDGDAYELCATSTSQVVVLEVSKV